MKTIIEAYDYLQTTSNYNIFRRIVPYAVWCEYTGNYMDPVMLHIMVAAFAGPFKFNILQDDPGLRNLLFLTDYGRRSDWGNKADLWLEKHFGTPGERLYWGGLIKLIGDKQDPVADYLYENHLHPRPTEYYLPELSMMGFTREYWERV